MAGRLEVALLGPVEVRLDGQRVALSGSTQRILVARLAISRARVVPAVELVDLLWGEVPPAHAAGDLQTYVSRLRRVLGRDRVQWDAGGYRLQVAYGDVDVDQVELLVGEARALERADPVASAARLAEALERWRGEPLGGVAENLALAPEVSRLREWRVQLLADWLELRLGHGSAAAMLPELDRAARAHPARERLQVLLMRGLHRDGRTPEALAVAAAYRRRLAEDFGLDPGPDLAELQQRMLTDDPTLRAGPVPVPRPRRSGRRNAPGDRFVGRAEDLERLRDALASPGLTTVVGPAGVGKTRLVQELLDALVADRFAELVELEDVSSPGDLAAAVATALGLRSAPAGTVSAVVDRLGAEADAVLVLDNCEHVLDAASRLAGELTARCPELRVLATSRQRLGVRGERVVHVGPLGPADQVELFCDRASLLRAGFDPSQSERAVVAEICQLVDGMPLGVELAARREAVFGLYQLRERLAAGLGVLDPVRGGDRTTALTATVEWSYRLLAPAAKALFDRLAVCRGGFGPDALPHLAGPGPAENAAVLLAELVEASMVDADLGSDPPRYRLLATMRQVALAHVAADAAGAAVDAHARWMQAHIEAVGRLQNDRSPEAAVLLRRELDNLREALVGLTERGQWEPAGRLGTATALALSDDPHLDLLAPLRRLAGAPGDGRGGALCRFAAGAAAWVQGDAAEATQLLTDGLDQLGSDQEQRWVGLWFRSMSRVYAGDVAAVVADTTDLLTADGAPRWVLATAVCNAALIHLFSGDRRGAESWMARHERLLDDIGMLDGFVAYTHGELAAEGDPAAALACYERAYRLCEERGHAYNREVAAVGRAAALLRLGRHDEAATALRGLLDELRRKGMWAQLWTSLRLAAELLVELGDTESAGVLLAAADADPLAPAVLGPDRDREGQIRHRIGPRATHGRPADRVEAVACALAALPSPG